MADKIDIVSVSYVLGILSIVFAFFSSFGLAGLVLGIVGFSQSKKHGVKKAKNLNLIGIILSIVVFIISSVALLYSVKHGLTSSLFPSI